MPIIDRYGCRVREINTRRIEMVLGPANRGVKTGLDTRIKYVSCEVAVDPITRRPVFGKTRSDRAYMPRTNSTN